MCACVFTDVSEVTPEGMQHLGNLTSMHTLSMRGLPDDWLTDDMLGGLHGCSQLYQLDLRNTGSLIQADITAPAVTRSVRLHIHTQAAACLHPG